MTGGIAARSLAAGLHPCCRCHHHCRYRHGLPPTHRQRRSTHSTSASETATPPIIWTRLESLFINSTRGMTAIQTVSPGSPSSHRLAPPSSTDRWSTSPIVATCPCTRTRWPVLFLRPRTIKSAARTPLTQAASSGSPPRATHGGAPITSRWTAMQTEAVLSTLKGLDT